MAWTAPQTLNSPSGSGQYATCSTFSWQNIKPLLVSSPQTTSDERVQLGVASRGKGPAIPGGTPVLDPNLVYPTPTADPTIPRDPPKSTTKGRAKQRRIQSALELHPKRKNKCSYCSSTEHNSALCKMRLVWWRLGKFDKILGIRLCKERMLVEDVCGN